jgi:hypothetical protein
MSTFSYPLIPAKAGTQAEPAASIRNETLTSAWVPAFAGMSGSMGMDGMKGQRP